MQANIPSTSSQRIVILGAGFAGLALARKLSNTNLQVVLLDKNNYHQFQPLFYQVATAGLEPSSISFPLRKVFHRKKNVHIRITEVLKVLPTENKVLTGLGEVSYDYLVIALGADTNFFGMEEIKKHAFPMKSVSEALALRNRLLQNFEDALIASTDEERNSLMNVVVVGGGATGVEVSGTLAEMKKTVLPKDYPELDFNQMKIYLFEGSPRVLNGMSEIASKKAREYLENLGVVVQTGAHVKSFDGRKVELGDGSSIATHNLIWAAGVKANTLEGLPAEVVGRAGRLKVNEFNQVEGFKNIFAIGDIALMTEEKYPNGHPQVCQPAIQQGTLLAKNLLSLAKGNVMKPFRYKDLGSMATVGRNLAVVDLKRFKFQGFFAWMVWMFVHLMAILGVKNRFVIFFNWLWNYITYDQSLRLIIRPKEKKNT